MTFSLRRKRQTIPPAALASLARRITSTLLLFLAVLPGVQAQSFMSVPRPQPKDAGVVTPAFVANPDPRLQRVVPAHATQKGPMKNNYQAIPVAAQQPAPLPGLPVKDEDTGTVIRTELPGPQRLFIRESEEQFWARYRNELIKESRLELYLPERTVVSREPYVPRCFAPIEKSVEPNYVLHRRLYFEQPNFERTQWNLGILTPGINLGTFYYDAALFPYHFWSNPHDRWETSAGKCLPGDQAPLLLYRERYSTMGLVGQLGTVTGLLFLFP